MDAATDSPAVVDAGHFDAIIVQPVHSACDGKTRKLTTADPFTADFESGDLQGWYDFGAAGALNRLDRGSPGAAGTSHALHLAAVNLTAFGAGVGFNTGCMDVSAFDGISFWARGSAGLDGAIQAQIALPATHEVAFGGDCIAQCNDLPSQKVTLGPDWKHYAIAFSDMTQAGFGARATYGGIIMAMNWVSMSGPTVDFWVDEVTLYSKVAPTGPVGNQGAK